MVTEVPPRLCWRRVWPHPEHRNGTCLSPSGDPMTRIFPMLAVVIAHKFQQLF
ncbi:hypothetical protein RSSM_05520 [Rhodopirellula sallentina SM41]|uniref:Uncharacterized protein n=1 Tax=Rhodopirellula sallentina SM41 TaxID=1263870 RepID=M5U5C0_9BACT|nr:hypothetical protein RSSM_05520 [Rhodopirellula sallentina SM41]